VAKVSHVHHSLPPDKVPSLCTPGGIVPSCSHARSRDRVVVFCRYLPINPGAAYGVGFRKWP